MLPSHGGKLDESNSSTIVHTWVVSLGTKKNNKKVNSKVTLRKLKASANRTQGNLRAGSA